MVISIVIFIFTLLVLVLIHELGHFLVAKRFNIKVLEFGFGIPPRAWSKKLGETLISLNWLPFGGFVRLLGEDETDKNILQNPRSFAHQKVLKRISVVFAGVVMNLVLAWILFYVVLAAYGFKTQFPLITPHKFSAVTQTNENLIMVADVVDNSPAQAAGISIGERIVTIGDGFVGSSEELQEKIKQNAGKVIKLTLSDPKSENLRVVELTPRKDPPQGQGPLGVALAQIQIANIQYNGFSAIFAGPIHSWNLVAYSGKVLGSLIGKSIESRNFAPVSQTVSGPVGITTLTHAILSESKRPLISYLDFIGLLSLNLAVFNLLPIPALDGGRLFFLLIEVITKRKIHPGFERWVHTAGMAILLTLMLLITISDVRKLFQ